MELMAETPKYHLPAWLNFAGLSQRILRSRALRALGDDLVRIGGSTTHSARGETLAYFVARAEAARVPYTITAQPGLGYSLEVVLDKGTPAVRPTGSGLTAAMAEVLEPHVDNPAVQEPEWEGAERVHDWRNYVGDELRALWGALPPGARAAVYLGALRSAEAEEWGSDDFS